MRIVYTVLFALVSVVIGTLLVRDHASREKISRLDRVCEHVREQLCLRLAELDERPGAGHVQLPSNVEIDACAPDIWNDWKLGAAVRTKFHIDEDAVRDVRDGERGRIAFRSDPCLASKIAGKSCCHVAATSTETNRDER